MAYSLLSIKRLDHGYFSNKTKVHDKMGIQQATATCFSKYAVFSGRAQRSEYWWFVLFVILASIGMAIIDAVVFGTDTATGENSLILTTIFQLAVLLPLLAAGWRRLHDSGRPGWYLLLPAAFSIATVFMMLTGVAFFSAIETGVEEPETLRGPAALLGVTGLMIMYVLQLVFAVLMIWWLSRPSQAGSNEYGPPLI